MRLEAQKKAEKARPPSLGFRVLEGGLCFGFTNSNTNNIDMNTNNYANNHANNNENTNNGRCSAAKAAVSSDVQGFAHPRDLSLNLPFHFVCNIPFQFHAMNTTLKPHEHRDA